MFYSLPQDKAQPDTQAEVFGNVKFHAKLAIDHADAFPLVKQPGSDGFSLSSSPLFQVSSLVFMLYKKLLMGKWYYLHFIIMDYFGSFYSIMLTCDLETSQKSHPKKHPMKTINLSQAAAEPLGM